jgi:pyruvate dehydrogenase E1 component alpha subunit
VELVRDSGGPVFLEAKTFRFRAHSMFDPDRYRDKAEVERWRERDPLLLQRQRLLAAGVDESELAAADARVSAEIDAAVAFAEAGTDEPVEDLLRFVTTEEATS